MQQSNRSHLLGVDATTRRGWRPVLEGALAQRALESVLEIAHALHEPAPAEAKCEISRRGDGASLAGGKSGLALFYAYLSQAHPGNGAADTAVHYLEQAFDQLPLLVNYPSLYSGFTGIAWATAHLQGRFLDPDSDAIDPTIDEALLAHLSQSPWQSDYDLIVGLVGMGVYALERLPNPTAMRCLEQVITHLAATATAQPGGLTWWTNPAWLPEENREHSPQGYYNLGLAHGVPGIIAFLGATYAALPSGHHLAMKTRALLHSAVTWLLAQRQPESLGSAFTYWLQPGQGHGPSRLAWCYGDPGVAIALLAAARHVGEATWEQAAIEIGLNAALRPVDQAGIKDAGICHGAAGLGHIFNRFYQATGHAQFATAARFWFAEALAMRKPNQGIAGYLTWGPGAEGELAWVHDPGLLTGAAGIGLTLLAATTSMEPTWDRMLLTDAK